MTSEPYIMRKPCAGCGNEYGRIETRSGQDCVYCEQCNRFQYNAPKTETGRAPRTVETVHNGIKPKQRARIFTRDGGRCFNCGRSPPIVILHVGHMISVKAGLAIGMTEVDLNDDQNLVTLCDECNLGVGDEPMELRFCIRAMLAHKNFKD